MRRRRRRWTQEPCGKTTSASSRHDHSFRHSVSCRDASWQTAIVRRLAAVESRQIRPRRACIWSAPAPLGTGRALWMLFASSQRGGRSTRTHLRHYETQKQTRPQGASNRRPAFSRHIYPLLAVLLHTPFHRSVPIPAVSIEGACPPVYELIRSRAERAQSHIVDAAFLPIVCDAVCHRDALGARRATLLALLPISPHHQQGQCCCCRGMDGGHHHHHHHWRCCLRSCCSAGVRPALKLNADDRATLTCDCDIDITAQPRSPRPRNSQRHCIPCSTMCVGCRAFCAPRDSLGSRTHGC